METTYKQNEMSAYKLAVQLEGIIKKESFSLAIDWKQRLTDIEQQIQTRKFRIAVVGEFNRGKSSFINVLLGKRILPEDVLATTATINRVTYGEKPKAYLIMKQNREKSQEIPVEELNAYVTKLTESSEKKASEIHEAVVEYPTMLCYNDVDLIDTPGMNDMDDMNEITVNRLEDIDLAIVAINAQYPYSETENRFVVKLLESKKVCQIIFVITHFDMIRDREKEKLYNFLRTRIPENVLSELEENYLPDDKIFLKYHLIFDNLHLYGVSSLMAMDALETNNMELYEKSGFLQLSRELPQVILSSKSVNMIDNIVTLIEEIIDEYKAEINKKKDEWKLWENVQRNASDLFAATRKELEEIGEEGVSDDAIWQDVEQQKQSIVKSMLMSLGNLRESTSESIHQAMLPAMQVVFRRINLEYQNQKKQMVGENIDQRWRASLKRLVSEVNDQIQLYPDMYAGIQTEYEVFSEIPCIQFLNTKTEIHTELSTEECSFFWTESPMQVVLNTDKNRSVLPGLQKIVDESMNECVLNIKKNLKETIHEALGEIEKKMNIFLAAIELSVVKRKEGNGNISLLSDIDVLQKECNELHKKDICDNGTV